ncbi:MAG: YraN family protein [Bacteroidota bacterium]
MAQHNDTGKRGEALALELLQQKKYVILETNWRYGRLEVDIIAMDGDTLVFVEVKTRTFDYYGKPETFVDKKKMRLLQRAAQAYMHQIQHDWAIRFDVVAVLLKSTSGLEVRHLEEAFFPW